MYGQQLISCFVFRLICYFCFYLFLVLDPAIFGLCFVCFVINLVTVPVSVLLYVKQFRERDQIYMKIKGCNCGLQCRKCNYKNVGKMICISESCIRRHSKAILFYIFSFGRTYSKYFHTYFIRYIILICNAHYNDSFFTLL